MADVRRRDRTAAASGAACAVVVAALAAWLLGDLLRQGWAALSWDYLLTAPENAGRGGGIGPILVSTVLILGVCLMAVLPPALLTAILLAEWGPRWPRALAAVRLGLDLLAGVPSIVFGLFGMVVFGRLLGLGSSILAGGLALACMVLPLLTRLAEEALRAVPGEWRLGAAALGLSRTTTLWRILLPAALPGIAVALVLALGRALAETAALLFTSGYLDRMPESLLDSGRALSVHIYDLALNVPGASERAAAAALVLIALSLVVNGVVAGLCRRWGKA
jgi:phosphate transport system permease protein